MSAYAQHSQDSFPNVSAINVAHQLQGSIKTPDGSIYLDFQGHHASNSAALESCRESQWQAARRRTEQRHLESTAGELRRHSSPVTS